MTLVLLIVGGLAVLGFVAGQASGGGAPSHPARAAAVATPNPTYARQLDAVMTKLNATRSSAAARLRGAHDATTQMREAQALAAAHTQAAAAVAPLSRSAGPARTVNSVLTQALRAVGSAYGSLAGAAAENNDGAYRSAQAEVIRANQALQIAFAELGHFGYRLG